MKTPPKILIPLVCLLLLANAEAMAQQHHFIYIQSDEQQPFYVMLKTKVFSSSETGYLIIPKLTDGKYEFKLGFPLNKYPEQSFTCKVDNKDAGYSLKNFDSKGWGLADLETSAILMAGADSAVAVNNSAFGDMLSEVVDDSALAQKNTIVPHDANTNTYDSQVNNKSEASKNEEEDKNISAPVFNAGIAKQPVKLSQQTGIEGTELVFVDKNEIGNDTIRILIPSTNINNENVSSREDAAADSNTNDAVKEENTSDKNEATDARTQNEALENDTTEIKKQIDNPFYKKEETAENKTSENAITNNTDADVIKKEEAISNQSNLFKEDCRAMISDDDLDKMKRKMFSQKTDDKMVEAAGKFLAGRCLNTEQVKALSVLFMSDEGRYNLFDAMYKYVFDYGKYSTLESQIVDPYYKKRFMALLRN